MTLRGTITLLYLFTVAVPLALTLALSHNVLRSIYAEFDSDPPEWFERLVVWSITLVAKPIPDVVDGVPIPEETVIE